MSKKIFYKLLFCAITVGLVLIIALLMGWPDKIVVFSLITAAAISFWITDALPGTLVGMILPPVYIVCQVATPAQVLAPWAASMCWLVLGGVILSTMMDKCGVSRRIALWALNKSGASLKRLFWGLMLAGFLIAPFVPTAMGKAALFVVILGGICSTLQLQPGSREASCIFICGLLALACPKFLFFTASVDSSLLITTARQHGMDVGWMQYFIANAIPGLIYAIACVLLLILFAPQSGRDFGAYVKKEYNSLGPMNIREKKALGVLGLVTLAMLTDSWHGLDIGWLIMLISALCFMPGINLLAGRDMATLPLGIVFFIAGCMSIGSAAYAAGIDRIIIESTAEMFQGAPGMGMLLEAFLAGAGMSLGFTTLPAVSTMTPALTQSALAAGPHGHALLYAFLYGADQYLLPYVFAPALYFYAYGYMNFKHYLGYQGLKLVLSAIILIAVAMPWWLFIFSGK